VTNTDDAPTIFAAHWKFEPYMQKGYQILTVTHKTTTLQNISRFMIDESAGASAHEKLKSLMADFEIDEMVYVPTCNRVMYFFHSSTPFSEQQQLAFLQAVNPELSEDDFQQVLYFQGSDALTHLFQVTASVDSLVVGEREILRQVRQAYEACRESSLVGDNLRMAIEFAVQSAKEIYTYTKIGQKPVSVVSLAINRMMESGLAKDARILLIGAGQTNQLVGKFLKKYEYNNVSVFNRTPNKAATLAEFVGGKGYALDQLATFSEGFDCIITCTGAQAPVLTPEVYQSLLVKERDEKMVIDLAVPQDLHPRILKHFNVNYIDIEDLRSLARINLSFREKEVEKAQSYLKTHVENFAHLYQQRQLERAMQKVPQEIKAVKKRAMEEVFHRELSSLDPDARALLERALDYMEKKCISIPMKAARQLANA
jgi:glutamyl-tRNA reductase